MKNEAALAKLFHKRLSPHGFYMRVENGVGVGFPDCIFIRNRVVTFIELKKDSKAVNSNSATRVAQREWRRLCEENGGVYIIVSWDDDLEAVFKNLLI